jgi:Protein of unknown function (DUF3667)
VNRRGNMNCKNCGSIITDKYCSKCGQEIVAGRLTLGGLLWKFAETITHAEHGIFRLIWELSIHPARVSLEYIEGRRKKYFNPVKYLVVVVSLSAILVAYLEMSRVPFEPTFAAGSNIDDLVEYRYFNHNYYKYYLFLSIPLAALISFLIFRNSGFSYAENLVLNTYVLSQVVLLHTILITPLIIYSSSFDDWIIFVYMTLAALYLLWSYFTFFKGKSYVLLMQSAITLALFTFAYNLISHNVYLWFGGK